MWVNRNELVGSIIDADKVLFGDIILNIGVLAIAVTLLVHPFCEDARSVGLISREAAIVYCAHPTILHSKSGLPKLSSSSCVEVCFDYRTG